MYEKIVKHILFPIHEKILGRDTYKYLDELETLQYEKPERLEEIRFRKLRELLIHAKDKTLFYKQRFATAGFDPVKMQAVQDIQALPILTKAEIRQNIDAMQWKESPGGLTRYNTGGSSGEPRVFYFDRRRQAYDAAARALTHRWWGIDVGDKELYLWGSPLEITKQDKIKDLRDRLTNDLLISAFEISERKIPGFVAQFEKFKPKCVFGYPSTIALFCEMAAKQNYRLDKLGVAVVLLEEEPGGSPFDEANAAPWWKLQKQCGAERPVQQRLPDVEP